MLDVGHGQPFSPPAAAVTFRGDSPRVAGVKWMILCAQPCLLLMCWRVDDGPTFISSFKSSNMDPEVAWNVLLGLIFIESHEIRDHSTRDDLKVNRAFSG